MKYMFLIYGNADHVSTPEEIQGYIAFSNETREKGTLVNADQLQPITTATSLRGEKGKAMVTDGPFAETKEVLAGYYILECADLDEALTWGHKLQSIDGSTVEVRPLVVF